MVIITTITKIFKKVLTIGTPPEDDVLYSKIVKRKIPDKSAEALVVEDFKKAIHNVKSKILDTTPSVQEEKEPGETVVSKVTTVKRSSSPKKATTAKSKTETSKKASVKQDTGTKTETKKQTKTAASKKTTADKKVGSIKKKAASSKKPAVGRTTESKKTATDKTKGTKREAKIILYTKDIKKHYNTVDEKFLEIIVKNLGPSIYRRDAELVSCSDSKELDTVRRNFLMKKLGLQLSKEELDAAIQEVCQELKSTRTKYRATFYYRLAQKFKKESALS